MKQSDPEIPESPSANSSAEEKRIYGRELAIDALLQTITRKETTTVDVASTIPMPRKSHISDTQKAALYSIAAMFAVLLTGIGLYIQDQNKASNLTQMASIAPNVLIVDSLEGSAYLRTNQNTIETKLKPGSAFSPNSTLRTNENSQVTLRYRDGTTVTIGAKTDLTNLQPQGTSVAKHLRLDSGNLQIEAMPQARGTPMEVYSAYANATVLGTRFTLEIQDTHTELIVEEGAVDFTRPDHLERSYIIQSGQVAALGPEIDFIEINELSDPVVHDFSLIDVATGEVIAGYDPIPDGCTLSLTELPSSGVNIRVNATGRVNHMHITNSTTSRLSVEEYPPFTVAGDLLHYGGRHLALKLQIGAMTITATPHDRDDRAGLDRRLTVHCIE